MSLNMFKNKLYNMIIAVSLVVAIVTVTSYVPEMFEKQNNKKEQVSNEIKYEEPQIKVESARKILNLTQTVNQLNDATTSKEDIKQCLSNMSDSIAEITKSVRKEVKEAKKKADSEIIINRAEEYQGKVEKGLGKINSSIIKLSENLDLMATDEIKTGIKDIVNEIDDIQKVETPEVKYNDKAHGVADGYDTEKIVGEELVESNLTKLSVTPEANDSYLELNDEIRKIADELKTPAEVYEYVKNNYQYKQYTGLRLGAIGTYEQRAGNDFDQASLLIALYRYKGYDAKFVVGNIDIDINRAMNWLGVKTEKAAVDAMSMLGVPTQYGQDEKGNITKLRIEHTWIKVKVPYDTYRGAGKIKGEEIWIELDPSFKQYEDETENNSVEKLLSDEVRKMQNLSEEDELKEALIESDYSEIFNCDLEKSSVDFLQIQNDIENYLTNNNIDIKEVSNAIGLRYIVKDETGYLPSNLPYTVIDRVYDDDYLSENFIDKVTFSLQSSLYGKVFLGTPDASISFYTADLYGHKISLTYKPASEDDEKIIEKYGSLFSTPSYLVRVKPVISIDENEVLEGNEQIPGTYTNLIMDIDEAGIENVKVENPLIAGGVYGITFDYNTINDNCLTNKHNELQECVDKVQSGEISLEQATSTLTNTVGEVYFSYVDYYDQLIAKASDVQWARSIGECIVGYVPKVNNIMGVPVAISDGTLYIDVDTDTVGLAYNQEENIHQKTEKIVRNNANIKNFMMASGLMGSYLEGYVVGEATNTKGVSSVSIIKESKERGINIVTLSEENKAILNMLSIDKTAKNEIEKALNNGKTVIVPEKSIQYYDWNGTGYITLNPETGEAAYMISGGLCGGESSQDLAMTLFTIIVAVAAIFAIAVFVYFAWSAIAAMIGVALTISEGISILDTCIILLSMAGAIFSITEAGNVGIDAYEYIIDPSVENGSDILRKAVEAGAMFLIFEVAMPRLISSVSAKINFDESGFYKFVTKKWGGKTIKTPPAKPDTDPDLNSDADPDTNPNKRPLGDYWEKIAEKYGQDIVDKLRPFGNDGKRLIEQYGDELVDIISGLSEKDTKQALKLIAEFGDDAINGLQGGKSIDNVKFDCLGGKQYRDKLLNDVESGKIELKTNKQKGNYGEMKMDKYFEELGYERISLDRVTGLDDPIHQGIDGVYYNPEGTPQYIIAEAKYGSARLGNTADGPQMSDLWIKGSNRLRKAVGNDLMIDININGYDKWLIRVTNEGNVIKTVLE
ncbi:transglutaminase domain-containing protein [Eubacterium sp. CAG:156]|mgnify:CR=1 FL=1|uniref:transglutaminase domain-containing protein n=1 Tax=Eubacterium sp. CAG:156 TaxID=1262880 RepID=UPI00033B2938|nr:putative uncharacterized protein [Eubacterium sp. CAG:156]